MIGIRIGMIGGIGAGGALLSTLRAKLLFYGKYSQISGGQMPNILDGGTTYLTVAGVAGSETYQCPNTAPYIAADTDYIWFDTDEAQRTTTTADLIGYDFIRTIIRYNSLSPYEIEAIMILSSDIDTDKMRDDFKLSVWWDDTLNAHGELKGNRTIGKSSWIAMPPLVLQDGHTKGWYKPTSLNGRHHVAGVEDIYWDKTYPYLTLSDVLSSGNIATRTVYIIVATTTDFFYTGCQPGDMFICSVVKTLRDPDRSVRQVLGNHLTQSIEASRPVNQVFDGIDDYMHTPTQHALAQPTFIYMLFKQITWANLDIICDGSASSSGQLQQADSTPKIKANAGLNSDLISPVLDTWVIIRVYFNGANSKLILNDGDAVTGDFGATDMVRFTLAARGTPAYYGNIQISEIIIRDTDTGESDIQKYLNYIKSTL